MDFKGTFRVLALLGAIVPGMSANVAAQEPSVEARQAFYDECDWLIGKAKGICMRSMAERMQNESEEARQGYKDCLEQGESRSECDKRREAFWRDLLLN